MSALLQDSLLGILAIAFLAWAGVVWKASRVLSEKFDAMRADFHIYSIRVEHRLTCLEEKEVRALNLIKSMAKVEDSDPE